MDGCKRKRRRVPSCPNPLFAQWIEEWRDEAIEKGLKSSYTYSKVINALYIKIIFVITRDAYLMNFCERAHENACTHKNVTENEATSIIVCQDNVKCRIYKFLPHLL